MKSETQQVLKLYFAVEYGLSTIDVHFEDDCLRLKGKNGERTVPFVYLIEDTSVSFKFKADTLTGDWQLLITRTDIFFFNGGVLKEFIRDNRNFVKHHGDLWQVNRNFIPTNILNSISV